MYKLCELAQKNYGPEVLDKLDVVWISSPTEQAPCWNQARRNELTVVRTNCIIHLIDIIYKVGLSRYSYPLPT